MELKEYFNHETAIIDTGAVIGKDSRIWHFCHISARARLGSSCNLGQNVFIDNDVVIGNGVKIQNNVSVYKGVIVEDDVFLGPSMVFTNVINPRSFIERKNEFKLTRVGRGSTIGANATIICGNDIGNYALIGAGAVVSKNVPAYAVVVGNPGRQVGWVTRTGLKIRFNENGLYTCPEEGITYQLVENEVVTVS